MKKLILLPILITSLYSNEKNKSSDFLNSTSKYRDSFHESLKKTAKKLDSFIVNDINKELSYDKNYLLIENISTFIENEKSKNEFNLKLKLYLPKLKEKYRLSFETENDEHLDKFTEENKEDNDTINLILSYRKNLAKYLNLNTKVGVRITSSKLNPFIKFKLDKKWLKTENKYYLLSQEFKISAVDKYESKTVLSYNRKLKDDYTFIFGNEYYWQSINEHEDNLFHLFSLKKKYSKKNQLSYNLSYKIDDKDRTSFKLKRYSFYLNYQHNIREWLYINLKPENFYREDNSFKPNFSLQFKLSFLIGNK